MAKGYTIDLEKCSGCGQCLRVCPDETLGLVDGQVAYVGDHCIGCGHCVAVCPEGAIQVEGIEELLDFATFSDDLQWLSFGEPDTASLVRLMRSRRSCRNYTDKNVSRQILEDLVKIAITAPSGTNSQGWTFSLLENREQVLELGQQVCLFFEKLNKLAANPLARLGAKIFFKDRLGNYFRKYYQTISHGLEQWREKQRDLLFHGATAVILVGGKAKASCPAEDALLATQNILLAAHSMGLGSCLIGFAVEAIKNDPHIQNKLGLEKGEAIYSVIALGYPAEKYHHVAGRKRIVARYPFR